MKYHHFAHFIFYIPDCMLPFTVTFVSNAAAADTIATIDNAQRGMHNVFQFAITGHIFYKHT